MRRSSRMTGRHGPRHRLEATAVLCVAACASPAAERLESLPASWPRACVSSAGYQVRVDTLARGLNVPWGILELPDGRILVSERAGRIRLVENGLLRPEPWAELEAASIASGEGGLLGLAWLENDITRGVLAVRTVRRHRGLVTRVLRRLPGVSAAWRPDHVNELVLIEDRGAAAGTLTVLAGELPSSVWNHAGGEVAVGPDGMIYLSLGDARDPATAADPRSPNGAVLRLAPDGSIPSDNPLPEVPVFAFGLRNVQGLDWHPVTGELFATDHGPTGMDVEDDRRGQDELNLLVPGGNYGWPVVAGPGGDARFQDPVQTWHPVFAPARLRFVPDSMSPWWGSALITTLRHPGLVRLELHYGEAGWQASCQEVILDVAAIGRTRALAVMRDGTVLIGTSNRDGRGQPRESDDLLLQLTLVRPGRSAP